MPHRATGFGLTETDGGRTATLFGTLMTRPEIRLRLQAIEHDRSIEKKARIVPRETREAARGSERCFARGGVYWTSLRANRFVILHVLRERTMIVLGTDTVSESMAGRSHRQFSLGCMISRRRSSWRRRRGNPHRNRFPDGRKMFWRRRSPRNRRSDLGSWASNKSGSSAHREKSLFRGMAGCSHGRDSYASR